MMRPPVQKSALQQNEANRLQHQHQQQQQQTHKHLQQQQQIPLHEQQSPTDIIATNISDLHQTENIARKSKLEQRELLVENHLNSACFAQVHHHHNQQQQQQQQLPIAQQPHTVTLQPTKPTTIAHKSIPRYFTNDCYQQRSLDCGSSVKLLELSTSPPSLDETVFRTQTTPTVEVLQDRTSNNSQQRYSFASQYSSRSSSSDDSSSLSLTTAVTASGSTAGIVISSNNYNASHNSTFDDAAENFIINFPADTSPLPSHASHSDCCLPLSETEPLLTNIEATVNDKQRSIYLNKNSASLIFTRKDLTASTAHTYQTKTASAYQQEQQKTQFKLQSKANNNFNGTNPSATTQLSSLSSSSSSSTATLKGSIATTNIRRQNHSTLRSFSEENYKRKPTKHLPATYHQQHRRSLQLNYNNNLVTTTTCGNTFANNNHYCHGGSNSRLSSTHSLCCPSANTNSAVLHKTHHNNHNLQQQQQQHINRYYYQQQQQQQQQQQPKNCNLNSNTNCTTTNNTAAATRKQYAYSWYAPVYSALEEELEQDSRVSNDKRYCVFLHFY